MSAMSRGPLPARRAASAIRSCTTATFSAIDIRQGLKENMVCSAGSNSEGDDRLLANLKRHAGAPISNYIIAVGGAGSLGSPALVSGSQIIKAASTAITIIPAR